MLLDRGVLAIEHLVEGAPLVLDLIDVEPVRGELVPLAFESLLTARKDFDLGCPFLDLAFELLNERDERHGRSGGRSLDRVLLEIVTGFRDGRVGLFH